MGPAPATGRRSAVREYGRCHRMQAPAEHPGTAGGVACEHPLWRATEARGGAGAQAEGAVQGCPVSCDHPEGPGEGSRGGAGGRVKVGLGEGGCREAGRG